MGVLDKLKNKIIKNNNPMIEKVPTEKLVLKGECITTQPQITNYQPIPITLIHVEMAEGTNLTNKKNLDAKIYKTQNFIIPRGMSIDDACLVLSYLTEKFDKEYNYPPSSRESVSRLAHNLPKYGFEKEFNVDKKHLNSAIKLYTVSGNLTLFKQTDMYKEYFPWFTPNVAETQVNAIYAKAGKELPTNQTEPNC